MSCSKKVTINESITFYCTMGDDHDGPHVAEMMTEDGSLAPAVIWYDDKDCVYLVREVIEQEDV